MECVRSVDLEWHKVDVPDGVEDLTGRTYGRWEVLYAVRGGRWNHLKWWCRCSCPDKTEKPVAGYDLRKGDSQSCSCLNREIMSEVGKSNRVEGCVTNQPERKCWLMMVGRCTDPKHPDYPTYGAVGITVCDRWLDYEQFKIDIGPRPSPFHTLDRYPNKGGNYEPGNVRWATAKEQGRNQKTNVLIEAFGKAMPIVCWSELTGLTTSCLGRRIRVGWDHVDAVTTPSARSLDKFVDPRLTLTVGLSAGLLFL